ncbi:MAG: AAA family ATPase, partial [Acidobacteriota bacterium]
MSGLESYPLRDTAIYNPHLLSREELISLFAARRQLLGGLLEDISRCEEDKTPQHHLLLAQRGMGKTMLLRRLQFAIEDDPKLAEVWLPLTFPEEQYNIGGLSDLWMNCIDALGDTLERLERSAEAERLDSRLESLLPLDEERRERETRSLLTQTASALDKRLVLLIDNIDLILERIQDQAWALREMLSEEGAILLIGASAHALEVSYKYDQPFYDFFQIHELGGLNLEETENLLRHYAERWGSAGVLQILSEEPGRIRTLHTLTGGNPRTITLLYTILGRGLDGDVRTDLESLLDQCTPLYKARLEALSPQQQRTVHALAVHWNPASAAQVASELRLGVNAVSSQLTRLVRAGVLEAVPFDPKTKTGFQLAERFFNIWYLMRATRRARKRLIWLVEFLRMFYS